MNFVFSAILLLSLQAFASPPYDELDKLRQSTVVVRVALDNPGAKEVKACHIKASNLAQLGANLSLQTESAKAEWQHVKVAKKDLPDLRRKIKYCVMRGSCSVYSDFLSVAKADKATASDLAVMKIGIDTRLQTLTSKSYLQAWSDLKNPCSILKSVL